jgi:hypothetical protein
MADTQINVPQTVAAPSTYQVRDGVELLLKAVHATFTDNGAAASWLPAVVIKSDSGHTVAHAVDQAVTVAAGSGAEVSFFRGVKHAASAGGFPACPWAMVSITFNDPGLAIGATNVVVPYDLTNGSDTVFMTSDSSVFSLDSVNHAIVPASLGFYAILTSTRLRQLGVANAGNVAKWVSSASNELPLAANMTSFLGGSYQVEGFNVAGNTFWDPNSLEFADVRTAAQSWQHIRTNLTGAVLVGQRSVFAMIRLGDSVAAGTIP